MKGLLLKIFAASLMLTAGQPARPQDCGALPPSRKLDEYGGVTAEEEKTRLQKIAAALDAEDEDTKAFIVGYAGRSGRAGEAFTRADRAKQFLNDKSYFYNTRINTLDCGRREAPATEIWITPPGASPPACAPTLATPAAAPPAKGGAARRAPRRRSGRP